MNNISEKKEKGEENSKSRNAKKRRISYPYLQDNPFKSYILKKILTQHLA
jgi:hypothetical protein